MVKNTDKEQGFTLVEIAVSVVVFSLFALGLLTLYAVLVLSSQNLKHKSVALSLATEQLEYLKSLPYDSLAVSGGSIPSPSPLPASNTKTINNFTYVIYTSISYVDDAYDGCTSYPTQQLKETYCRNYPPPTAAPTTDSNPQDYKIITVTVKNQRGDNIYAKLDTKVSARVAETASTTGALFVRVLDDSSNPVVGATVNIVNTTLSPAVNLNDTTDIAGYAIFYSLPPDTTNNDYIISASMASYSSLTTIKPTASLTPTYTSVNIFAQQSTIANLPIYPKYVNSMLLEATTTSGTPIQNLKIYAKGGYKKYTSSTDTSYYYDSMSPSDIRPTTDTSGMAVVTNLTPGSYYLCGDDGSLNCKVGSTTYYLAAAVPYEGVDSFLPVEVPSTNSAFGGSFDYLGVAYRQRVLLLMTTQSTYPRVKSMSSAVVSKTDPNISAFNFVISGKNLPCTTNPATCSTIVRLKQGALTITASCTGTSAGTDLSCTANLSSTSVGMTYLELISGGNTLTIPQTNGLIGGIRIEN